MFRRFYHIPMGIQPNTLAEFFPCRQSVLTPHCASSSSYPRILRRRFFGTKLSSPLPVRIIYPAQSISYIIAKHLGQIIGRKQRHWRRVFADKTADLVSRPFSSLAVRNPITPSTSTPPAHPLCSVREHFYGAHGHGTSANGAPVVRNFSFRISNIAEAVGRAQSGIDGKGFRGSLHEKNKAPLNGQRRILSL